MNFSKTNIDLAAVLAGRKNAGHFNSRAAFPLHTKSEDSLYSVLSNGVLSIIFELTPFLIFDASILAETLPYDSGIQYYRHFYPEEGESHFLVVSTPVLYSPPGAISSGFKGLINPFYVKSELKNLEEATALAYQKIIAAINKSFFPNQILPQSSFEKLLDILEGPKLKGGSNTKEGKFNMNYLMLPNKKFGFIADCSAFPENPSILIPEPPEDLETLFCTNIHIQNETEQKIISSNSRDIDLFDNRIFRPKQADDISPSTGGNKYGSLRQYFLFLSPNANNLISKTEPYISSLNHFGFASNVSLVSSVNHYFHLFPGNYMLRQEGMTFPISILNDLVEKFEK